MALYQFLHGLFKIAFGSLLFGLMLLAGAATLFYFHAQTESQV